MFYSGTLQYIALNVGAGNGVGARIPGLLPALFV